MKAYKYTLGPPSRGLVEIMLPRERKFLHLAEQHGGLSVWYLVDPDDEPDQRVTFHKCFTGEPVMRSKVEHRGTLLLHDGLVVVHVFEAM